MSISIYKSYFYLYFLELTKNGLKNNIVKPINKISIPKLKKLNVEAGQKFNVDVDMYEQGIIRLAPGKNSK